ncbi:hypothetical protein VNO80_13292 [Phaseolus coccineus]|uniref:Uncharacterized protein n=1 Tax=Phaseolus coccineus TaxID=3886 RepID=A0AAN9N0P2_PHACN
MDLVVGPELVLRLGLGPLPSVALGSNRYPDFIVNSLSPEAAAAHWRRYGERSASDEDKIGANGSKREGEREKEKARDGVACFLWFGLFVCIHSFRVRAVRCCGRSARDLALGLWVGKSKVMNSREDARFEKGKGINSNRQSHTMFFFSNFPYAYGYREMFKLFQKWGRVFEVFIAKRLNAWGASLDKGSTYMETESLGVQGKEMNANPKSEYGCLLDPKPPLGGDVSSVRTRPSVSNTHAGLLGLKCSAILKRKLFATPEDENSGSCDEVDGERRFFKGESSKMQVMLRAMSNSGNSRQSITDSNILNCNRLFWSKQDLSTPLRIWELGKELGVTYEGEQEMIIQELEEMKVRDRKLKSGPRGVQGYPC